MQITSIFMQTSSIRKCHYPYWFNSVTHAFNAWFGTFMQMDLSGFLSQYITFSIKPWVLFKEGDIDFRKNLINSVCPCRLGTDILFGNNCGLKTILVLTGISSLADVDSIKTSSNPDHKNSIPDFYMPGIEALRLPLKSVSKASSWL